MWPRTMNLLAQKKDSHNEWVSKDQKQWEKNEKQKQTNNNKAKNKIKKRKKQNKQKRNNAK